MAYLYFLVILISNFTYSTNTSSAYAEDTISIQKVSLKEELKMKPSIQIETSKNAVEHFKMHWKDQVNLKWNSKGITEAKLILKGEGQYNAKRLLYMDYSIFEETRFKVNGWSKVYHPIIDEDELIRGWEVSFESASKGKVSSFIDTAGEIYCFWFLQKN